MTDLPSILYRDEAVIAFDKPSGLLSVPGIGPEKADCLAARAAAHFPGARIVHRLDRDTSGVIIMALDAISHRRLSIQFQEREVTKSYLALVSGDPGPGPGEIDLPIRKDLEHPPRQIVDHEFGRASVTRWVRRRVLPPIGPESSAPTALLEVSPLTGRSHQIRLHLKEIGHPLLGDDLYAPPEIVRAAPRLMLHAWRLALRHPLSGAPLALEAPPAWMERIGAVP